MPIFMGHSSGSRGPTLLLEQSPLSLLHSSEKRPRHHHYKCSRKKQKKLSLETENQFQGQTRQCKSIKKLSSYTHRQTILCNTSQRRDRNGKKSCRTFYNRKWTYTTHDTSSLTHKLVLISYNILSVENVVKHPELYRDVSPEYLDWDYRKKILWNEVKSYQPSILCFQEVDRFDDLNYLFVKNGFKGVHKARAGDACDGCAIFWKAGQFTLLHEESIDFQMFGLRDNVAQFCVLKMNKNLPHSDASIEIPCDTASPSLLVGNIHVLYNPKRGDIKLGQMRIFLQKAYELSQKWGCIPVVIAGDLNSLPHSAMYQFLASSKLHIKQHDRKKISGQIWQSEYTESRSWRNRVSTWTDEELMLATGSRDSFLRHPLKLLSAYSEIPGSLNYRDNVGEPLATSYHCMFSGTVDYIWHTSGLIPVKILETLPINSLKETGGLPSKKWGSDHLALVCELAFADDGN